MTTRYLLLLSGLALCLAGCAQGPTARTPLRGVTLTETPYSSGVGGYLKGATAELAGVPTTAASAYLGSLSEDPDNLNLRMRSLNLTLLGNDVPTALRLARTLPASHARQVVPQLLLVMGNIRDGKLDAAHDGLAHLVEANPEVLQFQGLLQRVRVAQGVPVEQAVKVMRALELPAALEGRRQYQVARLWLAAGHTPEALAALEDGNAREPGAMFTTLLLGQLYERNGQPEKAQALYDALRARNPGSGLLAGMEARIARGDMPPPYEVSLARDASVGLMDFSLLLWAQGVATPARQLVNVALWTDVQPDPWLLYYAAIVEDFGANTALAVARYQAAAKVPGLELAAGVRLAELRYRGGDAAAAKAMMEGLMRAYPAEPAVWRSRAEMAVDARDYPVALESYERLEALLPQPVKDAPEDDQRSAVAERVAVLFAKGAVLERMRRQDEAEVALKQALALDPASAQVLNYLGYMWVDQGKNIDEAFALLQRALSLAPNDGAIVDSVGWAYYRQKDYAKALVYLERAAELVPDDATVTDHLGDVYAALDRREEARQQWQRALEQLDDAKGDDHDPSLRETLKQKLSE